MRNPLNPPNRAAAQALLGMLVLLVLASGARRAAAAEPAPQTIRLVVDYGDGAQMHFTALPWRPEMTVMDALVAAQKHPHGITFAQKGRGELAMVTEIGNIKNEGSGKNWLYSVNDKTAEVGAGAYQLKNGDRILWEFKAYE